MNSIKVLITEDEPPIGRFIKNFVEEMPGFTVCGVCCSGEEGLVCVEKEHPDVLITDIRMPGMSGLELIRAVRERKHDIYTIVISGYKMFEYAREAIQLDASAYILKPIRPEELREILYSVHESCEKKHVQQKQEALQTAFRKRDEDAFFSELPNRELRMLAVYYGFDQKEIGLAGNEVSRQIFWLTHKNWIFFLQDKDDDPAMLSKVEERISLHSDAVQTRAYIRISSVSSQGAMIAMLHEIYKKTLRYMVIPGKTVEADFSQIPSQLEIAEIPDSKLKNLMSIDIQSGDVKRFKKHFFELFELWEEKQAGISHIRGWMHEITTLLIKNGLMTIDQIPFKEGLDEIIWHEDSFVKIRNNLWKELEKSLLAESAETEALRQDEEKLFDQICSLIKNNPEQNDSLQRICDRFHVSQPYVRKIFRIHTGKTYNEYQLEWKVQLAQQLMDSNPTMLVREVAERIGFESLYFGTVFSKYTGMTPSQYKSKRIAEKEMEDARYDIP